MTWILADDATNAPAYDDAAILAPWFDRWANLHNKWKCTYVLGGGGDPGCRADVAVKR